jgi:predicted anti-sigma-YlaC factor YlaD
VNCVETIDLMDIALDGVLPRETRPSFDEHIGACRRCRTYFEQLTTTVRTLGRLPVPTTSNPRRAELLERYRRSHRPR